MSNMAWALVVFGKSEREVPAPSRIVVYYWCTTLFKKICLTTSAQRNRPYCALSEQQTIVEYLDSLKSKVARLQNTAEPTLLCSADITTINLTTFKDYLKSYRKSNGKLIAASTVKNYLAVFGAFVNDLAADGLIQPVNMKKVGHIKVPPSENVYCTEEEMARIDAYYDRLLCKPNHQAECTAEPTLLCTMNSCINTAETRCEK